MAVQRIAYLLHEVEFVALQTEGKTIKSILPKVPYYQNLYTSLGEFAATERKFTGAEELSLEMLRRLARAPQKVDTLRNDIGADRKIFDRAINVGEQGAFLVRRHARGRDIVLSPTYFLENAETFADLVASSGADTVRRALAAEPSPVTEAAAGAASSDSKRGGPRRAGVAPGTRQPRP